MQGIPAYVTLAYAVGLAGAPLILFVPPPRRVARHATVLCVLLLRAAALLAVAATGFALLDLWWPALTLGGLLLVALMTMFWSACEPRRGRARPDDDEDHGGGGEPRGPQPPRDPDGPGGIDIDWPEFDRRRETWQRPTVPT